MRIISAAVLLCESWATKRENQPEPQTNKREGGDTVYKGSGSLTGIEFPQRLEFKEFKFRYLFKTLKDHCLVGLELEGEKKNTEGDD